MASHESALLTKRQNPLFPILEKDGFNHMLDTWGPGHHLMNTRQKGGVLMLVAARFCAD